MVWIIGIIVSLFIAVRGLWFMNSRHVTERTFSYKVEYLGSCKSDNKSQQYFYKIEGQTGVYKTGIKPIFYQDLQKPMPIKIVQAEELVWYGRFWGIENKLPKVKYINTNTDNIKFSLPIKDKNKAYVPFYKNGTEKDFSAFLEKFGYHKHLNEISSGLSIFWLLSAVILFALSGAFFLGSLVSCFVF